LFYDVVQLRTVLVAIPKGLSVFGLSLVIAGFVAIAAAARETAPLPAIEAALVALAPGSGGHAEPDRRDPERGPPEMLGVATSAVSFFRSLGGAFGVALSGSLLTSRVNAALAAAGNAADAARRAVAGGAGGDHSLAARTPRVSSPQPIARRSERPLRQAKISSRSSACASGRCRSLAFAGPRPKRVL
jgi:hypothetical protein